MTDITVATILANVFKGHLLCSGEKDVRYYLNGVYVDIPNRRLVSTDGHQMLITKLEVEKDAAKVAPFVIKSETLADAIRAVGKQPVQGIQVDISNDGLPRRVTLHVAGGRFMSPEIEGSYPDYSKVVPRTVSGKVTQFNPELLENLQRAVRTVLGVKRALIALHHNGDEKGDKPAPVTCSDPNVLGILMPWRGDDSKLESALKALSFDGKSEPPKVVPAKSPPKSSKSSAAASPAA